MAAVLRIEWGCGRAQAEAERPLAFAVIKGESGGGLGQGSSSGGDVMRGGQILEEFFQIRN